MIDFTPFKLSVVDYNNLCRYRLFYAVFKQIDVDYDNLLAYGNRFERNLKCTTMRYVLHGLVGKR